MTVADQEMGAGKHQDAASLPGIPAAANGQNGTTFASDQKRIKNAPDAWFYPNIIANDLKGIDLPSEVIAETLACSWEYTRCVIPQFTNWNRYIAFTRIIIIGIIAEFHGALIDVAAGDHILGYDLNELFDILFEGTPGREAMAREYRTFLLITADKCSDRYDP